MSETVTPMRPPARILQFPQRPSWQEETAQTLVRAIEKLIEFPEVAAMMILDTATPEMQRNLPENDPEHRGGGLRATKPIEGGTIMSAKSAKPMTSAQAAELGTKIADLLNDPLLPDFMEDALFEAVLEHF